MILFDICSVHWLIPWLLLPLLGLLLGWLLWGKLRSKIEELQNEIRRLKGKITALNKDHDADKDEWRVKLSKKDSELKKLRLELNDCVGKISKQNNLESEWKHKYDTQNAELKNLQVKLEGLESKAAANLKAENDWKLKWENENKAFKELELKMNALQAKENSNLEASNEWKLKWENQNKTLKDLQLKIEALENKAKSDLDTINEWKLKWENQNKLIAELKESLKACEESKNISIEPKSLSIGGDADMGDISNLGIAKGILPDAALEKYVTLTDKYGLQIVEGIGPKMDEVLHKYGVTSLQALSQSTPEKLREILDTENASQYRIIDPTTWPRQASLAVSGQWDELIADQKGLSAGKEDSANKDTDSKVEKLLMKMGLIKQYKKDDLKAIEGIGPKIEAILKGAGIDTWQKLSQVPVQKIQSLLDEAGPHYKLADPGTWPKQAALAAQDRWKELQDYQDILQGGK